VRNGDLELKEVPPPALLPGGVLVRTAASLISGGTEKTIIELGKKSLIGKARERPDIVRQVIAKARTQGQLSQSGGAFFLPCGSIKKKGRGQYCRHRIILSRNSMGSRVFSRDETFLTGDAAWAPNCYILQPSGGFP